MCPKLRIYYVVQLNSVFLCKINNMELPCIYKLVKYMIPLGLMANLYALFIKDKNRWVLKLFNT